MLTVPLITETKQGNGGHETTLGVLHVLNKGFGNPFTPEDVRLVGILARQVVEVIVAGQLFTSGTEMTKYLSTPNPLPNYLVLTSQREPPFSLEQLRSLGIKPEKQRILVVKAAIAFRAAYQPIAGRIIEVNTPGLTCIDPKRFDYRRVRRPLFGLE